MQAGSFDEYYDKITDYCLDAYAGPCEDPLALATGIMQMPGFPMHYPTHHYMVPAVLLTAARKQQGHGPEVLKRDLEVALERARTVPGGSCGFQGACGAAVGTGIFFSIITDSTPLSKDTWALGNRATGEALIQMAEYGGPRCCKRCSYLALQSVLPRIEQDLGLKLKGESPVCGFYEQNESGCLQKACPFYPKQ